MTLHPAVRRLGVLGSLPEYDRENDTDARFLEIRTGLSELEQTQVTLTAADLQTLTALFPTAWEKTITGCASGCWRSSKRRSSTSPSGPT